MAKSIKRNYIYNLIQQILTLLTPLITTPYISRVIGAEGIGIYSYASSIVTYFALFAALGTATYGQREISYCQDDKKRRSEVFWNNELLCIITTCISLCFYGLFCFFQKENRIVFFILSLSLLDVCLNVSWLLTGLEEFGKIVLRNIIIKVVSIGFIFTFVRTKDDFIIYVLGLTLALIISDISLWPFVLKFIDRPKVKDLKPFSEIKVVFSMFVPTIAISIYTVLDKTMIGIITKNAAENGFYEQALKISRIALTIVTSLGAVMIPRIGYLFEKHDNDLVRQYMYRSYRFVGFIGIPMGLGLLAISPNFVPWFFGKGFEGVIPLIGVLGFLLLSIGINNVTGVQYLIPTKRQNTFTKTVLIGACVNLIANICLIPSLGAIGAAIASVLAETIIAITQLWIVRKEISSLAIIKQSLKYIISGFIMFFTLLLINKYLQPSIMNTLVLISSGCFVYFSSLFILRDSFFIENTKKIISRLRKTA
jgi:polysaccharide biosynthesis protein